MVHTTLPQDGGPLQGAGPGGRPPRKALPHAAAKPFVQSLEPALTLCAKRRGDHGRTGSCGGLWIETRFSARVRSLGLHRTVEASGSTRRLLGCGLDAPAPCATMRG